MMMFAPKPITDLSLTYLVRNSEPHSEKQPPLLLLLHGVGSDEQDLFGLTDDINEQYIVVSARAPFPYPFGGNSWFEIDLSEENFFVNENQLQASLAKIQTFLTEIIERYHADPQQVYIGGFSQGGFMALFTALTVPQRIAGVIAMSSRLAPDLEHYFAPADQFNGKPVLMVHGRQDDVIPIIWARRTRDILLNLPVVLEYHEFDMKHEVTGASLDVVLKWLDIRLSDR